MVTKMQIGDDKYTSAKNKKKVIKVVLQVICLLALAVVLVLALFTFRKYVPFQQRSDVPVSNDRGFVALSYFGVSSNEMILSQIIFPFCSSSTVALPITKIFASSFIYR